MTLGHILVSLLLGSSESTISNCMDSIVSFRRHDDFDFEKCTGISFDEIEIKPLDSLVTNPNLTDFQFKGFRNGEAVYTEKIVDGRLAFHIRGAIFRYKIKDNRFVIWSNKKQIPANIMIIEKE